MVTATTPPGNVVIHVLHVTQSASWLDFLQPVGTFFALVAAAAAWRSAAVARDVQLDADRPQLVFSIKQEGPLDSVPPQIMRIENVGQGVAVFPGFQLLLGNGYGIQARTDRNLATGGIVQFTLPMRTPPGAAGIAWCEDRHNCAHVWSDQRTYRQYKMSERRELTPRRMFADLRPDAPGLDNDEVKFLNAQQLSE